MLNKQEALADYYSQTGAFLAYCYDLLGLTEDANYWMADALLHTPQPEQRFYFTAFQFQVRGDLEGIAAEIDKLREALGTDLDGLQGDAAQYASANIFVANYDVGIDVFEKVLDLESLSLMQEWKYFHALEHAHALAYAYQQVGRRDDANVLLTRIHERLNHHVTEENLDFARVHHLLAQNAGLRGDFDAAADAMEAAINDGWLRTIEFSNNPAWAETIADPRIARMIEGTRVELERQRAEVKQADADDDFRAKFAAMQIRPKKAPL